MNQGQSFSKNPMNYVPTFTPYPKLRPVKSEGSAQDELSQALQLLSPNHIQENLTKILKFLKSDGKELDFSMLTSKTATFLVQLVKNYNNFKHKSFHSTTLQTGIEIFNILEENRSKYKLVHSYDSAKSNNNGLVYKKQFYSGVKQVLGATKKTRMLSPKSRAFNKEKLPESNNNVEIEVSSSFKINWLNETIRFLRDETRTEIEYKEMSTQESEFVQNIIQPFQNNDIERSTQSLYSGLWGILKECTLKNDLSIAFKDTGNPKTVILTLLKFPKTLKSEVKNPTVKSLTNTATTTGQLEKEKSAIPKLEHKSANPSFLKNVMQEILSFINDDLRATLSIGDLSDEQSQVVLKICNKARNNESFPNECQDLARKLKTSLKNLKDRHLVLNINNDKQTIRSKNEIIKTVKFSKAPKEGKSPKTQNSHIIVNKTINELSKVASRLENTGNKMTTSSSTQGNKMITSSSTQGNKMSTSSSTQGNKMITSSSTQGNKMITSSSTQGNKMSTSSSTQGNKMITSSSTQGNKMITSSSTQGNKMITRSSTQGNKIPTIVSTQRTNITVSSMTNMTSNSSLKSVVPVGNSIQDTKTGGSTEGTKDNVKLANLPKNKKKMMEDMSVPVESDIGMRMMLLMGWEGGALGARGEGITEPIIPALDLAKRAGLGHVIEPKNMSLNNKSTNLKKALNQHIMDLVNSDVCVKEIEFGGEFKKKDKKYIKLVIDALNDRRGLNNSFPLEVQSGVLHVLKQLNDKPEVVLQYCIMKTVKRSPPATKLTLTKTLSRLVDLNNQLLPHTSHKELITNDILISISMRTGTSRLVFERQHEDVDMARFRITFLVKSLEFLKANIEAKEFKFESTLSLVMQSFMNDMVDHLNGVRLVKVDSHVEIDVIGEIKDRLRFKPFCLKLQIHYDLLSYVLEKTSKGVQIQVPTHFPNKVFYNKYHKPKNPPQRPAQQIKNLAPNRTITTRAIESDDDVILIEKDIPVLFISDDEDIDSLTSEVSSTSVNKNSVTEKAINVDNMQIVIDGVKSLGNNFTQQDNNNNTQKKDEVLLRAQNGIIQAKNDSVTSRTNGGIGEKSNDAIQALNDKYGANKVETVAASTSTADSGLSVVNPSKKVIEQSRNGTNTNHGNKNENLITAPSNKKTNECPILSDLHLNDQNNNKTDHSHKTSGTDLEEIQKNDTDIDLSALEMNEDDLLDDDSYDISIDNHILSNKTDTAALAHTKDCKEKTSVDFNDIISDINLDKELVIKDGDDTSSSKRSRTEFEEVNDAKKIKRTKFDKLRHIRIVPENYPEEIINYAKAEAIQTLICKNIDGVDTVLPRLKCLGIQSGGLVYFCYTEISYYWLVNILDFTNSKLRLKIVDFEADLNDTFYVLALKIRSFIRESCDMTFKRIKQYNKCLSTDGWLVLEETRKNDILIIKVEVDSDSYDYIVKENFTLHAGIDEAQFSIIF